MNVFVLGEVDPEATGCAFPHADIKSLVVALKVLMKGLQRRPLYTFVSDGGYHGNVAGGTVEEDDIARNVHDF
jgi:hypothetical protein